MCKGCACVKWVCWDLGVQEDDHQRLLQQMASRLTMSDFYMGRGDAQAKSEPERRTQAVGKHNRDFPLQQSVQRHVLSPCQQHGMF